MQQSPIENVIIPGQYALNNLFLEDVMIEGFKSFSEPTNMSFKPGINVVIGNNGVGKSNILDAIAWGLGENDLTKLRCRDIKELFFQGSSEYSPAKTIRVELSFRDRTDSKSSALKIRRALDVEGNESFSINNDEIEYSEFIEELAKVNLKNVTTSIIRQEEINDLVNLSFLERQERIKNIIYGIHIDNSKLKIISDRFERYLNSLVPRFNGRLIFEDDGLDVEVLIGSTMRRKIHQMSGGEKSVISLALKTAIFEELGSPLFLLDEVEPSLDYVNHKGIQWFLKQIAKERQLIVITHLRATVEIADTLHGVRTRPDGSSFMKFYFVMDKRLLRLYKCC